MKLFVNELVKLKHSKAVRGVFIAFMCLIALVVMLGAGNERLEKYYGFGAPFTWILYNGAAGFFLYAVIVAGMIAGEFESDVIRIALASGISRSRYFFVKIGATFGASAMVYLLCASINCAVWTLIYGFDPEGLIISNYILKVLAYNAGALILILGYVALYTFFAYLFRVEALTFIAAVVATVLDLIGVYRGPMRIAMDAIEFFHKDAILSWDFAVLCRPCIYMMLFCLVLSYGLFLIRDVD